MYDYKYIMKDEMGEAVKLAVAMCEESEIDTGKIINQTNLAQVS